MRGQTNSFSEEMDVGGGMKIEAETRSGMHDPIL